MTTRTLDPATRPGLMQRSDLLTLLNDTTGPCISIYLPTSRFPDEAEKNRIAFKNQVDKVQHSLDAAYPDSDAKRQNQALIQPLVEMDQDMRFWALQSEGLAVLRSPEGLWLRGLIEPVDEVAVVADSFHIRPLIRTVESVARYRLLCVSAERVRLYEGFGPRLAEVPLHNDVPGDMAKAIGSPDHVTKTRRAVNEPEESDQHDDQLHRFFRRVDDAIWTHHSEPVRLPLMLATHAEYHSLFRSASHNPDLIEPQLKRDPFHNLDLRELGEAAWETFAPYRQQRIDDLLEYFGDANAHGHGLTDPEALGRAAVYGQIELLMLGESQRIGGKLDRDTGAVTFKSIDDPHVDDLLDDVAEIVLRQGGRVAVLPAEQMPESAAGAAVLRYTISES